MWRADTHADNAIGEYNQVDIQRTDTNSFKTLLPRVVLNNLDLLALLARILAGRPTHAPPSPSTFFVLVPGGVRRKSWTPSHGWLLQDHLLACAYQRRRRTGRVLEVLLVQSAYDNKVVSQSIECVKLFAGILL